MSMKYQICRLWLNMKANSCPAGSDTADEDNPDVLLSTELALLLFARSACPPQPRVTVRCEVQQGFISCPMCEGVAINYGLV